MSRSLENALKIYEYEGRTFQFNDEDVPDGALEVKAHTPLNKQVKPADKAAKSVNSKPAGKSGD